MFGANAFGWAYLGEAYYEPVTVSATATLTGIGTVTAAATVTDLGAATLTGIGTVTAAATVTDLGAATLTGIGTVTAAATVTDLGAATLTGVGTLTATATTTYETQQATGTLTGSGTLTAAGMLTAAAAAALTGTGSCAPHADILTPGRGSIGGLPPIPPPTRTTRDSTRLHLHVHAYGDAGYIVAAPTTLDAVILGTFGAEGVAAPPVRHHLQQTTHARAATRDSTHTYIRPAVRGRVGVHTVDARELLDETLLTAAALLFDLETT